jgi:excinuclease ABC subunit B
MLIKETKSIKNAIKETDRRRAIQVAYNKKHNISATTIKKEIGDVLESVYEKDYVKVGTDENIGGNLKKHLKALNKRMKEVRQQTLNLKKLLKLEMKYENLKLLN